jgi:hypothetical protein
MKKLLITMLLIFPLWGLGGCNKDDDQSSQDPVSQLPEATQTGENTIGCLVDGEPLLPKGNLGLNYQCFYQFTEGEYYFGLSFSNSSGETRKSLQVFLNLTEFMEGGSYTLKIDRVNESNFLEIQGGGAYYLFRPSLFDNGSQYVTNNDIIGKLKITKFDPSNSIISGTFWFDAVNEEGEIVEIREGRFDMQYTN